MGSGAEFGGIELAQSGADDVLAVDGDLSDRAQFVVRAAGMTGGQSRGAVGDAELMPNGSAACASVLDHAWRAAFLLTGQNLLDPMIAHDDYPAFFGDAPGCSGNKTLHEGDGWNLYLAPARAL